MKRRYLSSAAVAVLAIIGGAGAAHAQDGAALQPFYGDISPFYGDISPFYGDISPFWGDISPFWGDISPFYGDISAFWGDISPFYGDISPFYGDISPFWGDISPFMNQLNAAWGDISPFTGDPGTVAGLLDALTAESEDFWGATVTARTGLEFEQAFVEPLLAKYGIDPENPETFEGFTDAQRAAFLFDWYDGLMAYSGRDLVDHWMATVNWTPALTQQQGRGGGAVIGLIDAALSDMDVLDNRVDTPSWTWSGEGSMARVGGHGGAVASLLVADHDGRGLMGVAPNASIALFNPFDEAGATDWTHVAQGVTAVHLAGASVTNLSLGVPGSAFDPAWGDFYKRFEIRSVLRNDAGATADLLRLQRTTFQTVFVHAAGNEGVAQTADINWDFALDPALIVVGSVGPTGQISAFSNTPGTACLVDATGCREPLMNRFIVAPGEWILVSDSMGGVRRQSGTSFAAPLVTGAVALIHGRWPWLRDYNKETVNLILASAHDLGAPGTDPVYGRGLLDITASQSPLPGAALYQIDANGTRYPLVAGGTGGLIGAANGYVTIFETVGTTYRDYVIPLNQTLTGTGTSATGSTVTFQNFVAMGLATQTTSRKIRTAKTTSRLAGETETPLIAPHGWQLSAAIAPLAPGVLVRDGEAAHTLSLRLDGRGAQVRAGFGDGASALFAQAGLGAGQVRVDGGLNPVLGLASGGGYVGAMTSLGAGRSLAVGFTSRETEQWYADPATGEEHALFEGVSPYRAEALHLGLTQRLTPSLALQASYTQLAEQEGLLGVQSLNPAAFEAPATTDAASIGIGFAAGRFSAQASATFAHTRSQEGAAQTLAAGADGLDASAYEVSLTGEGLLRKTDAARLRLAQPLHVEDGVLTVSEMAVVDRDTGALGVVTRTATVAGQERPFLAEAYYGVSFLDGFAEAAAFAQHQTGGTFEEEENIFGAKVKFGF